MKFAMKMVSMLVLPALVCASGAIEDPLPAEAAHVNPAHAMALFVMQLGVIILFARIGGGLFKKLKMPSVLGELISGIIIGPYLLGSIALPGMPHGFFPINTGGSLPVSMELYGVSTIASIILLFAAGLETDLKMFFRYSFTGTLVGLGGMIASFVLGNYTAQWLLPNVDSFMNPIALLLGVMSTATSVGITVNILSEKRKLDSPEGVTILAGAVIDDILGIILLAVIVGIAGVSAAGGSGNPDWGAIGMIAVKAISVFLVFTCIGLLFAEKLAKILKLTKSMEQIVVLSLGLGLLLAGVFEQAGLAMIIGAYVMGLSLSKTDLSLSIEEKLHPIQSFFVPVFFSVMGMMVDVRSMFSPDVLAFGLIYSIGAIVAKVIGAGGVSMFLNFNFIGALRIGIGMIPRGEVALIIGGIGLSSGILNDEIYSASIMMTLLSTLIAPVLLSMSLTNKRGTRNEVNVVETVVSSYQFLTDELTDLVETKLLQAFRQEGFFVNRLKGDDSEKIFRFQRESTMITYMRGVCSFEIESSEEDEIYVKNIVYETLAEMQTVIEKIKNMAKPEDLKKEVFTTQQSSELKSFKVFHPELIKLNLTARTKDAVIEEMIQMFYENGYIADFDAARNAVLERENAISTGMQYGVAIPHGRISEISDIICAIGIIPEGIDFKSLDGEPSKVFVMTLVPSTGQVPYVQFLAALSSNLNTREKVETILGLKTTTAVIDYFESENEE